MDLTKYKNRVSDSIFKLLLEEYPTGQTNDKNCPNLLFVVNKKEHVDFLIDELNLNILQKNFSDKDMFDGKESDYISMYKFWKYLSSLSEEEQFNKMLEKKFHTLSADELKPYLNDSIVLQRLLICRFNFFENIKEYSSICDVNAVIERFVKNYNREKQSLHSIFMGESYNDNLKKTLPDVSNILDKKNLMDLIALKLYSKPAVFYLYKNNFIDDEDMKAMIAKDDSLYRYTSQGYRDEYGSNSDVLIDKKTGFFKDIFNVYNIDSSSFSFNVGQGFGDYIKYAHPDKINLKDKNGRNVIFDLFSRSTIENDSRNEKINEHLSLFLQRGGDVNVVDNKGETCLSWIKDPISMHYLITVLGDNGVNILSPTCFNLTKTITDFMSNIQDCEEKRMLSKTLINQEKELLKELTDNANVNEHKNIKRL